MTRCDSCASKFGCKDYQEYTEQGIKVSDCFRYRRKMTVEINGAEVKDEMKCPWCGGTMHRGGATFMGAGVNSYTLWCDCGAIMHNAKDFSRKIDSFSIEYKFKEDEKHGN